MAIRLSRFCSKVPHQRGHESAGNEAYVKLLQFVHDGLLALNDSRALLLNVRELLLQVLLLLFRGPGL